MQSCFLTKYTLYILQFCLDFAFQQHFQSIYSRLDNLLVLSWGPCAGSDPADGFPLRVLNRQSSSKSRESTSIRISKSICWSSWPNGLLISMCTNSVACCCESLVHCNFIDIRESSSSKIQLKEQHTGLLQPIDPLHLRATRDSDRKCFGKSVCEKE